MSVFYMDSMKARDSLRVNMSTISQGEVGRPVKWVRGGGAGGGGGCRAAAAPGRPPLGPDVDERVAELFVPETSIVCRSRKETAESVLSSCHTIVKGRLSVANWAFVAGILFMERRSPWVMLWTVP